MYLRKLSLGDFRNYDSLSINIDSDINVFYGDNAQGKTNILEAVFICSCLRSHRTYKDSDLIYHERHRYSVGIEYTESNEKNEDYIQSLDIEYLDSRTSSRPSGKRDLKVNGVTTTKASEFVGLFHSVIFAPENLDIIKEGPAERRRFLDILISQVKVSYFSELANYSRILNQRNHLLKQMREGKEERNYLLIEIWDISLSVSASKIISMRSSFVDMISKLAESNHENLSSGREKLKVKYKSLSGISSYVDSEKVAEIIVARLKNSFQEDVDKGVTGTGPHRDDIEILIDDEPARIYASQGQQRTAVLALKIAEIQIIEKTTGNKPVLLLDDVMSELDLNRRKKLIESVGKAQVLITCTDRSHIELADGLSSDGRTISFFRVSKGTVEKEE